MTNTTQRIRALNDELRQHLLGGSAVITTGVAALGVEFVNRIVQTIALFDDFHHGNDPHQEHDFGAFKQLSRLLGSNMRDRFRELLRRSSNRDGKTRHRWACALENARKEKVKPKQLRRWLARGKGLSGRAIHA
jgi:hypothetical protein